jgi:zinc D-Ala-D-Ala dipeptidase
MKQYIESFDQLRATSLEDRTKYYIKKELLGGVTTFTHDEEELVTLQNGQNDFIVAPFWQDEPLVIEDKQLQEILNIEGIEFKKYLETHPGFGVSVRKSVVDKLVLAQSLLPESIKIVLKVGYRPIEIQKNLVDFLLQYFKRKYPEKNDQEIYAITVEYVSDPAKNIPPHSTGAAVDMNLLDTTTDEFLDMGSPINYPDERSWTYNHESLTNKQINNRLFITKTMVKAGFANLASEWWHYSYGDQRWAVFYDKQEAMYKSIES